MGACIWCDSIEEDGTHGAQQTFRVANLSSVEPYRHRRAPGRFKHQIDLTPISHASERAMRLPDVRRPRAGQFEDAPVGAHRVEMLWDVCRAGEGLRR